jgi:hypothetical protein
MKRWVWIVMGLWLLSPLICSAGWYKYQDANGVWHYTDSLTADVPVEKRQKAQTINEPDDYLTDAQRKEKRAWEANGKSASTEAVAEKAKQARINSQHKDIENYESLEKKRAELVDLYKNMMDKKRKLEVEKEKLDTAEAYKDHQNMVAEFNKRAAEYKTRRQAYGQAVKAFEAKK